MSLSVYRFAVESDVLPHEAWVSTGAFGDSRLLPPMLLEEVVVDGHVRVISRVAAHVDLLAAVATAHGVWLSEYHAVAGAPVAGASAVRGLNVQLSAKTDATSVLRAYVCRRVGTLIGAVEVLRGSVDASLRGSHRSMSEGAVLDSRRMAQLETLARRLEQERSVAWLPEHRATEALIDLARGRIAPAVKCALHASYPFDADTWATPELYAQMAQDNAELRRALGKLIE